MKKTQTKETTLKVLNQQGEIIGYLTEQDEEKGLDIQLDMEGYTIVAIDSMDEKEHN